MLRKETFSGNQKFMANVPLALWRCGNSFSERPLPRDQSQDDVFLLSTSKDVSPSGFGFTAVTGGGGATNGTTD